MQIMKLMQEFPHDQNEWREYFITDTFIFNKNNDFESDFMNVTSLHLKKKKMQLYVQN